MYASEQAVSNKRYFPPTGGHTTRPSPASTIGWTDLNTPNAPIIDLIDVTFAWPGAPILLDIAAFQMAPGERLFLRGASGSGKSTLLGLIAGVLQAQSGKIGVIDQDMTTLNSSQRDGLRADHLGVIFQMFNLVPYLTVTQNVALPCQFSARRREAVKAAGGMETEVRRLLRRLDLDDDGLLARKVTDLSVGQQQRVAAARALIGGPKLIIADEPTSALDTDRRDKFINLLMEEATASGAALLFVSHDHQLSGPFDRALDLDEINRAAKKRDAA